MNDKKHYCLPPLNRFDLDEITSLINQEKYFVLHAPRQTGKTSCLLALMEHLNATEKIKCLYINIESAQAAREDVYRGIRSILGEMADRAETALNDMTVQDLWTDVLQRNGEDIALNAVISKWCGKSDKPIVLLIDELDAIIGDTLISVLRQIRAGYDKRPALFPQSIVLCGVRDVRDYRIHSARDKAIITGGSAFNIKAKSLRLGDFTKEEMTALYMQHTEETAQVFTTEAVELAWELTSGQPWLVNALGYEVCFEMKIDRIEPVAKEMITQAGENIISRRDTHLDQLADKLKEERVRRVIEPVLAGFKEPEQIPVDDLYYARDLGLIKTEGQLRIANQIYREVIPRELTYSTQLTISEEPRWYIKDNGALDMEKLLLNFQEFFREHSEHWVERFQYKEAGPQLLMQAFLQRIVNSGGRVEREYGLGRMRTDLLVVWPLIIQGPDQKAEITKSGVQKIVIELKILYKTLAKTISDGLEQTAAYMDKCAAGEGHLVIFDRDENKSWDDKI
ncbi:MAG: ATP-binding protein, partial [Desulfosarcina sp.]|nr:ATP-binding protein [Desulfobacterales bacterium]